MSEMIQYDHSEKVIGGVNVAEAITSEKKLVFNESYTVIGEKVFSPSVYACYDLTVMGDVDVDDLEVHGNLFVSGNIRTKRLSCLKTIFCSGDIDADSISASEIIADNLKCDKLVCSGNVIVRSTIDTSESLSVEMSVMSGYGISGAGEFSAKNGVAADYFDFAGAVQGKVLELETDEFFGTPQERSQEEPTLDSLTRSLQAFIADKIKEAGEVDEQELINFLDQVSEADKDMLYDWRMLAENLTEIAYLDSITNLRDYLYVVMAKKYLPASVTSYETIEHVCGALLPDAETRLPNMEYHAKDIVDLAYSLKIAIMCEAEIGLDQEEVFDRIFQSGGIKYKTMKDYIGR